MITQVKPTNLGQTSGISTIRPTVVGTQSAINRTISGMEQGNFLERLLAPVRRSTLEWSARKQAESPQFRQMLTESGVNLPREEVSSPFRWLRTTAVPNVKGLTKPVLGEQASEDLAYGLRGATNIPTFLTDPKFAFNTLRGQRPTDTYEATTDRQKKSERIGQALYGQLLAAGIPLAGAPAGTSALGKVGLVGLGAAKRGVMGTALGTGFSTLPLIKEAVTTGQLPEKDKIINTLKEGAVTGLENSWMLAFTDMATDKVLSTASSAMASRFPTFSKVLSGLVQSQSTQAMKPLQQAVRMGAPTLTKANLFARGMTTFMTRALLEVPAEDAMWTAMNQLKGDEQRKFAQAFVEDLDDTTLGNIMYAGGQTVFGGVPAWKGTDWGEILNSIKSSIADATSTAKAQPGGLEAGFARIPGKPITPQTKLEGDVLKAVNDTFKTVQDELDIAPEMRTSIKKGTTLEQALKDMDVPIRGFNERIAMEVGQKLLDMGYEIDMPASMEAPVGTPGRPVEPEWMAEKISEPGTKIATSDFDQQYKAKNTSMFRNTEDLMEFEEVLDQRMMDGTSRVDAVKREMPEMNTEQAKNFLAEMDDRLDKYRGGEGRPTMEEMRGAEMVGQSERILNAELQDPETFYYTKNNKPRSKMMDEALTGKKPLSGVHYMHDVGTEEGLKPGELEEFITHYKQEAKKKGLSFYAPQDFDIGGEQGGAGLTTNIYIYDRTKLKNTLDTFGLGNKYDVEDFLRTSGNVWFQEGTPESLAIMTMYGQEVSKPLAELAQTVYKLRPEQVVDITNKYMAAESQMDLDNLKMNAWEQYHVAPDNFEDFIRFTSNRYNQIGVQTFEQFKPDEVFNEAKQQAYQKPYETEAVSQAKISQTRATIESLPNENPMKAQLLAMLDEAEVLAQQGTPVSPKYVESINTATNDLRSGSGLDALEFTTELAKQYPEMQKYYSKDEPITWEEWKSDMDAIVDETVIPTSTRNEIKAIQQAVYSVRLRHSAALKALEASGRLDSPQKLDDAYNFIMKAAEDNAILNNYASSTGRQLNALRARVESPKAKTIIEQAIKEMDKVKADSDDFKRAFQGVDLENQAEVIKATREISPPTLGEVVTEFRYTNLLSSPKTHIVNAFTNLLQAMVTTPGRKLFSGAVDSVFGALNPGYERQHYVSEVLPYYKGVFNALSSGDANKAFSDTYSGKNLITRPDVSMQQTMGKPAELTGWKKMFQPINLGMAAINKYFGTGGEVVSIPRGLEAFDAYWNEVIRQGQLESMLKNEVIKNPDVDVEALKVQMNDPNSAMYQKATQYAQEMLFRGDLDLTGKKRGQGYFFRGIDEFTAKLYGFRNSKYIGPLFKGYVPFIKTPMEILKQGIEYSPGGLITAFGAKDVADQLGKSAMGSVIMAMAYGIASKGDSTWSAPKGVKERERFYASGRKPYAIRIGDNWISYSRLGPLAYPIAWGAAVHYFTKNDPENLTDSKLEGLGKATLAMSRFFADQSYLTGISDLLNLAQGVEGAGARALTNLPRQMIPLTSLTGWITRLIDPIYRDPKSNESFLGIPIGNMRNNIMANLLYYSFAVDPYLDPLGNPSTRGDFLQRLKNSFLPWETNPADRAFFETYFQVKNKQKEADIIRDRVKEGDITPEEGAELFAKLIEEINLEEMSTEIPEITETPVGGQIEQRVREAVGASPETGSAIPLIPGLPMNIGEEAQPTPTTQPFDYNQIIQQTAPTPTTTTQPPIVPGGGITGVRPTVLQ